MTFRLATDPDRLWRGSEEVRLRAKSLSVLAYLARRPGRLVTKDELREQVWGNTHVSDNTLRVTVREIRAALGDNTTDSSYLETVPGRGYRFLTRPQVSSGLESAASQASRARQVNGGTGPLQAKASRSWVGGERSSTC
jgi:DNA-binding winged helix-turn-helix (wHTH) protein